MGTSKSKLLNPEAIRRIPSSETCSEIFQIAVHRYHQLASPEIVKMNPTRVLKGKMHVHGEKPSARIFMSR